MALKVKGQGQSKVMIKYHRNLITAKVNHNTYFYQVQTISSIAFQFLRGQTDRHTETDAAKTIPASPAMDNVRVIIIIIIIIVLETMFMVLSSRHSLREFTRFIYTTTTNSSKRLSDTVNPLDCESTSRLLLSILAPLPFVFCLSKSELSICRCHMKTKTRLNCQPCVVVSALASINEVNQRRARLVLRWVLGRGTPPPQTSPPRRLRRLDPLRLRRLRRLDTCAFDARPVPPIPKSWIRP